MRHGRDGWEAMKRFEKADAIASTLQAAYTHLENPCLSLVEVARGMNAEQRIRAAEAAGQRIPSEKTWEKVVELLEQRERIGRDVRRETTEAVA